MGATDELRRLLDERGVEYTVVHGYREYIWEFGESGIARASAIGTRGLVQMIVTNVTPGQAIDATLGAGTCHNVHEPPKGTTFWPSPHFNCSECGATHVSMEYVFYCPNCGRKVVDE